MMCILRLFSLLLKQNSLDSFLLLSKVFILKLEHVNILQIKVKIAVIIHLIHLFLSFLLECSVLFRSFLNQLVNIYLS